MSFYRAALAAANAGNLTTAARLVQLSMALGEDAPGAMRLGELLQLKSKAFETTDALEQMRKLAEGRQYKKALKIQFTDTSKAHTMRGLLHALLGRRRAARKEFTKALTLDTGNDVAWRALQACRKIKWWD